MQYKTTTRILQDRQTLKCLEHHHQYLHMIFSTVSVITAYIFIVNCNAADQFFTQIKEVCYKFSSSIVHYEQVCKDMVNAQSKEKQQQENVDSKTEKKKRQCRIHSIKTETKICSTPDMKNKKTMRKYNILYIYILKSV